MQYRLIRLATGAEIIGELLKEDKDTVTIKNPIMIVTGDYNPQLQAHEYNIAPYSMYTKIIPFERKFIVFNTKHIVDQFLTIYIEFIKNLTVKVINEEETINKESPSLKINEDIFKEFLSPISETIH